MNSLFRNLLSLSLILLNLLIIINCRTLSHKLNPNCNVCNSSANAINLLHIQSDGEKDSVHYLWSSITAIPPSFLIAKTPLKTELNINWTKLLDVNRSADLSGAIQFSNEPINAIGLQISRLFFFNDINKTGSYDVNYPILEVNWNTFKWKSVSEGISATSSSIRTTFTECQETNCQFYNGSVGFDFRVDANDGRNEDLPHLAFTELSTSLQMSVNDVITSNAEMGHFNDTNARPRLMAQVLVVRFGKRTKTVDAFEKITSIDDEYTPGVFDRIVLKLESTKDSNNVDTKSESFIEWKPIAYIASEKIIANTIDVIHSDVDPKTILTSDSPLLFAFFGDKAFDCDNFSITFGASDDTNYYDDKKYNSFSLVVGLDSPPDQKLSFLVQMIILVGFGLPLLVMVISALYLIVRKIRKRNYDDLLLSQESIDHSRVNS